MLPEQNIDIKENDLLKIDRSLLEILLKDKTTGKIILNMGSFTLQKRKLKSS